MRLAERRNALIMGQGEPIPQGYTALKYLQSSGHQRIATGIKADSYATINAIFKDVVRRGSESGLVFGSYRGNVLALNFFDTGEQITGMFGDTNPVRFSTENVPPDAEGRYTITFCPMRKFEVNDVSFRTTTKESSYSSSSLIEIFCASINRYPIPSAKCEEFEIIDRNDELAFKAIMLLRDSDNKPGMYDTVTRQFFVNQGTGEFGYELMDGTYVAPV